MKIPENWTKEQTLERLQSAHQKENEYNKELSEIDKWFRLQEKAAKAKTIRKQKLCKLISGNMRYRNQLINLL